MIEELEIDKAMEEKFGSADIEKALDEAEKEAEDPSTKYYSHEEVFGSLRGIINGKK